MEWAPRIDSMQRVITLQAESRIRLPHGMHVPGQGQEKDKRKCASGTRKYKESAVGFERFGRYIYPYSHCLNHRAENPGEAIHDSPSSQPGLPVRCRPEAAHLLERALPKRPSARATSPNTETRFGEVRQTLAAVR